MKKTLFTLGATLFILTTNAQIDMENKNLLDANKVTINDIGSGEGIDWKSGRNISVYSTSQGGSNEFRFNTTTFYPFKFMGGRMSINDPFSIPPARLTVNSNINEGPFMARINGNTKFVINGTGKVGIGTTSPSYLLDVNGALNLNKSVSSGVALRVKGSEALWYNGTYFSWGYGGSWNYFKDRVGIGTSSPSSNYMLSVNGKIRAKEIRVETGWADYVFEDEYELRTLEEVEAFIAKNGHLPDVPSAKEVEANGIELGSMDATLLRKLEEITLYLIELKKENEELKLVIQK
ncbi:hypothetical protein [Aquimarina sp. 2304DJ70-9]|uniref:hypothetical protein n=1 Tax=Aquimarina penaris TaxID=3231044 RepID=UPI00346294A4